MGKEIATLSQLDLRLPVTVAKLDFFRVIYRAETMGLVRTQLCLKICEYWKFNLVVDSIFIGQETPSATPAKPHPNQTITTETKTYLRAGKETKRVTVKGRAKPGKYYERYVRTTQEIR